MTMEHTHSSQSTKVKQKKTIGKLLLPNKIPNKVGVAVDRRSPGTKRRDQNAKLEQSQSEGDSSKGSQAVSQRPLSLDWANLTPKKQEEFIFDSVDSQYTHSPSLSDKQICNGQLRRCSSAEDHAFRLHTPVYDENKLSERCISHETVLKEGSPTSTNSLATKALIAAQVFHLIPTATARQRNYLQGRIGANSLLGPAELDRTLPKRQINIFVGTWNMNGQSPPKELNDFVLPIGMEHVPDILAFGTQESCSERFEWEVCLQETLGPSHLLFHSVSLVTEESSISVRPGTAFRTKGAVASAFMIFGTSFLFVNTHLTAHQEKVKERVSDVKKIVNSLDLPKILPVKHKNKDVTQNFDYVFWAGDLNFRLATPRAKVLEWLAKTNFPLPAHLPHGYLHHDQLCSVLADGAAFKGFCEANITFPPTYKYDPGSQNFDSSAKQRTPAYTDRILYKHRQARRLSGHPETPPLECLVYDSVPSIVTSDHKPVWGVFRAHVRPGIDTIPLAAGLFNRDIYLEGIRRRATALGNSDDSSTVCTLQ